MPAQSEFEEKEYEGPLYREMTRSDGHIWTPGQVLEGHLGIDAALAVVRSYWDHVQRAAMPGVVLATFGLWPGLTLPERSRQLPTFELSLFVQAKRPWLFKRRPSAAVEHDLATPCRCFYLDPEQQQLLETLDKHLAGAAEVTYACPCFHSKVDLFDHTVNSTLLANSTFPAVATLSSHARWLYDRPGAFGVAESEPVLVDATPIQERLLNLARKREHGVERANRLVLLNELHRIWAALVEALARRAHPERDPDSDGVDYAERVLEVASEVDRIDLPPLEARVVQISVALGLLGMFWLVVGPRRAGDE